MILNFKMLVKFDLCSEKLFTGLQKNNTTINAKNILIRSLKFKTLNQNFLIVKFGNCFQHLENLRCKMQ